MQALVTKSDQLTPLNALRQRIEFCMGGQKLSPWAESRRLSRGAAQRLWAGSFPDPVKLVPLLRIENLSMTWLLEGRGTPAVLAIPQLLPDFAQHVGLRLGEEPLSALWLLSPSELPTAILHQPVESTDPNGKIYRWTDCTMFAGGLPVNHAAHLARIDMVHRWLRVDDGTIQSLNRGWIRASSVFGFEETGGLIGQAKATNSDHIATVVSFEIAEQTAGRVAEGGIEWRNALMHAHAQPLSDDQLKLLELHRKLSKREQQTALKLLRALVSQD